MEGTCNPDKCKLHTLLGGEKDECPNYVKGFWKSTLGAVKEIDDCAPKRTLLMIQELFNRQIGLQSATEEQRNAFINLGRAARKIAEQRDRFLHNDILPSK